MVAAHQWVLGIPFGRRMPPASHTATPASTSQVTSGMTLSLMSQQGTMLTVGGTPHTGQLRRGYDLVTCTRLLALVALGSGGVAMTHGLQPRRRAPPAVLSGP